MSYRTWERLHFTRPPFFKTVWRDAKSTARRVFKEWMAWFEISV